MNVRAVLIAAEVVAVLAGSACGGGEEGTPTATPEQEAATPSQAPVAITFWHVMTAAPEDTLTRLTDEFNASQDRVTVSSRVSGYLR